MARAFHLQFWFHTARTLLAALGFLVCLVLATPLTIWYAGVLAKPWPEPKGDVLIVLAGAGWAGGFMGENTYLRCIYAARAYRAHPFRRVVVSGADTAPAMRDFLVYHGVPADRIAVENRSTTTRESALSVGRLLAGDPGTKVVLTSDYHAFRAGHVFRKAGLRALASPFPDAIKRSQSVAGRMPAFITELQETCKIGYYAIRGWL